MTGDFANSVFTLGTGITTASSGSNSFQKIARTAICGAFVLCLFGTSSISAFPEPNLKVLVSGSTDTSAVHAETYPSRTASAANQVRELHRRSGLTWEQTARIFGVDRRTVHLWAAGRHMRPAQTEKLGRIMTILTQLDRGSPTATRDFLLTGAIDGTLVVEFLEAGRFAELTSALSSATLPPVNRWARMRRPPRLPAETAKTRRDLPLPQLLGGDEEEPDPEII